MPFSVPPVTEDYNRSENPLSTNGWSNLRYNNTAGARLTVANGTQGLAQSATAFCSQMRTATIGPDCSARVTIPTLSADGTELIGIFLRAVQEGAATVDTYAFFVSKVAGAGNDVWQVDRIVDNANTTIGATATQEFAAGDTLGVQVIGVGATVTLEMYLCPSGSDPSVSGNYSLILTRADTNAARLVAAGRAGIELNTNVARIENWGDGSTTETHSGSAAAAVHLSTAVTGAKTGKSTGSAGARFQTQATGQGSVEQHSGSASAHLGFTPAVAGRKTAIGTHEEASPNPPFTTLVEGAAARVSFTTAATGQQSTAHAGPAAATLRVATSVAGRKTASSPAAATVRAATTPTGRKSAGSATAVTVHAATTPAGRKTGQAPCGASTRLATQATGTNTTPAAGAAIAQLRFAATCAGRGARSAPAAAQTRFGGQATGRKAVNGAAAAAVRHVTAPAGHKRTASGCTATVRLATTSSGGVGPPIIAATYPPAPPGHIEPAPAGYVTR